MSSQTITIPTPTPRPPVWVVRAGPHAVRAWNENLAWRCNASRLGHDPIWRTILVREAEQTRR